MVTRGKYIRERHWVIECNFVATFTARLHGERILSAQLLIRTRRKRSQWSEIFILTISLWRRMSQCTDISPCSRLPAKALRVPHSRYLSTGHYRADRVGGHSVYWDWVPGHALTLTESRKPAAAYSAGHPSIVIPIGHWTCGLEASGRTQPLAQCDGWGGAAVQNIYVDSGIRSKHSWGLHKRAIVMLTTLFFSFNLRPCAAFYSI